MLHAGIFAGGYGKRLMPLTSDRPKVLLEVSTGKTLMDHTLSKLKDAGIGTVHMMVGHLWERIEERYGKEHLGMRMDYLVEDRPRGTLWALKNLYSKMGVEDLLLMNGDVVSDLDLKGFIKFARDSRTIMTLSAARMRSPYGILRIEDGLVTDFVEKPVLDIRMNMGLYFLRPTVRRYLEKKHKELNIEPTVFSDLAFDREISAFMYDGFHCSLDSMKDLEQIRAHFSER